MDSGAQTARGRMMGDRAATVSPAQLAQLATSDELWKLQCGSITQGVVPPHSAREKRGDREKEAKSAQRKLEIKEAMSPSEVRGPHRDEHTASDHSAPCTPKGRAGPCDVDWARQSVQAQKILAQVSESRNEESPAAAGQQNSVTPILSPATLPRLVPALAAASSPVPRAIAFSQRAAAAAQRRSPLRQLRQGSRSGRTRHVHTVEEDLLETLCINFDAGPPPQPECSKPQPPATHRPIRQQLQAPNLANETVVNPAELALCGGAVARGMQHGIGFGGDMVEGVEGTGYEADGRLVEYDDEGDGVGAATEVGDLGRLGDESVGTGARPRPSRRREEAGGKQLSPWTRPNTVESTPVHGNENEVEVASTEEEDSWSDDSDSDDDESDSNSSHADDDRDHDASNQEGGFMAAEESQTYALTSD